MESVSDRIAQQNWEGSGRPAIVANGVWHNPRVSPAAEQDFTVRLNRQAAVALPAGAAVVEHVPTDAAVMPGSLQDPKAKGLTPLPGEELPPGAA